LGVTIAMDYCVLNYWNIYYNLIKEIAIQGTFFKPSIYLLVYRRFFYA
jgi:hypothetical protein